jgi:hypothetical protein
MMVKFRATSGYIFHEKMMKPGDIGIATEHEYEWLRSADCAIKIANIEPEVETTMVDVENRTERRPGRPKAQR